MHPRARAVLGLGLSALLAACDAPVGTQLVPTEPAPPPAVAAWRAPLVTSLQMTLLGGDGAAQDALGTAVAISGDTALAGAPSADHGGKSNPGAAYVFVRQGTSWSQQQKLVAGDPVDQATFGSRVAVDGDTAAIAAPGADTGAVYVFVRSVGSWMLQQKLTPQGGVAGDRFGGALWLVGDTLLVGAPSTGFTQGVAGTIAQVGAVYVFTRSGATWTQQERLQPAQRTQKLFFGSSVALVGDLLLAGAPGYAVDGSSAGAGAVLSFERPAGGTFAEKQTVTATDFAANAGLGTSVTYGGGRILAGAPGAAVGGNLAAGAVYSFTRATGQTTFSQKQKLVSPSPVASGAFGGGPTGLAATVNTLLVGAPGEVVQGKASGQAYLFFTDSKGDLVQRGVLTPTGGAIGDQAGSAVALSETTALFGGPGIDAKATDAGAALVYLIQRDLGEPCSDASSCKSGFCADGVCCDSACGNGATDCQACSVAAGAATDGTCGTAKAGQTCRPVADSCDAAEVCDGTSLACPADKRAVMLSCLNTADLAVRLDVTPIETFALEPVTYQATVQNLGPSAATQLTLNLMLPAGSGTLSAQGDRWVCTPTTAAPSISCVRAELAVDATAVLSLELTPPEGEDRFELTAQVSTGSLDPDLVNNRATLSIENYDPATKGFSGGGIGCTVSGRSGLPVTTSMAVAGLGLAAAMALRARRRRS